MRSVFTPEQRLEQTVATVRSLVACGVHDVLIADNSGTRWRPEAAERLYPARMLLIETFPYANKGISELQLLIRAASEVAPGTPVLKVSGRYEVSQLPQMDLKRADITSKVVGRGRNRGQMSTRCYYAKDREALLRFTKSTLRETYAYWHRVVGWRSFARLIKSSIDPASDTYPYDDPRVSIESAAANVLRRGLFTHQPLADLRVRGACAVEAEGFIAE